MKSTRNKAPQARQKRAVAKTLGKARRRPTSKSQSTAAPQHRKIKEVAQKPTQKALIVEALTRPAGVSLAELMTATGWQAHSIRAALTHLRKDGFAVTRRKDAAGETRYHLDGKAQ